MKSWIEKYNKWLSGQANNEERFELEKRALDDDFIGDAMEGIELYHTGDRNIIQSKLERKLLHKKQSKITILLPYAVAASIVLIFSVFYLLPNDPDSSMISEEQVAITVPSDQNNIANKIDNKERITPSVSKSVKTIESPSSEENPKYIVENDTKKKAISNSTIVYDEQNIRSNSSSASIINIDPIKEPMEMATASKDIAYETPSYSVELQNDPSILDEDAEIENAATTGIHANNGITQSVPSSRAVESYPSMSKGLSKLSFTSDSLSIDQTTEITASEVASNEDLVSYKRDNEFLKMPSGGLQKVNSEDIISLNSLADHNNDQLKDTTYFYPQLGWPNFYEIVASHPISRDELFMRGIKMGETQIISFDLNRNGHPININHAEYPKNIINSILLEASPWIIRDTTQQRLSFPLRLKVKPN